MKTLLLSAAAILAMAGTASAQFVRIDNNSSCDQYVTLYGYYNGTTPTSPYTHTSVVMIPANTIYGPVSVGSFSWSSGSPSCAWQLAISATEDLTCGTGGTGAPMFGGGVQHTYYTTCNKGSGCAYNTPITTTQNWVEHYTWPNGNPNGPTTCFANGEVNPPDMHITIN